MAPHEHIRPVRRGAALEVMARIVRPLAGGGLRTAHERRTALLSDVRGIARREAEIVTRVIPESILERRHQLRAVHLLPLDLPGLTRRHQTATAVPIDELTQ